MQTAKNDIPKSFYSLIGVNYTNTTNRIMAGQYPYTVKSKTVYINEINLISILEETLAPTVLLILKENGDLITTCFIPEAKEGNPYIRRVKFENNINNRLPISYLQ